MNFDRIAPFYRPLEWLFAGGFLHRARTAFLPLIPRPANILLLGDGNGRFLLELARRFPHARFTSIDSSSRMLHLARRRLEKHRLTPHIDFIHADALSWQPPPAAFDLIVTHFFLDCFPPSQLDRLLPVIASAAAPGACWLVADFRQPVGLPSKILLALLYRFFRAAARLEARRLTPPDDHLRRCGFLLHHRESLAANLLHSDWWTLPGPQ